MPPVREFYSHWFPKLLSLFRRGGLIYGVTIGRRIYYLQTAVQVLPGLRRHELAHVKQYEQYGLAVFLWRYHLDPVFRAEMEQQARAAEAAEAA